MKLNRIFSRAAVLTISALALVSTYAHATSFTYEFTLTPNIVVGQGTVGGTVLVTFDEAIPATGNFDANTSDSDTATTTKITSLTVDLSNGDVFTLSNAPGGADIGFFNGVANAFSYYANSGLPSFQINGVGASNTDGYQFTTNGNYSGSTYSQGKVVFDGLAPTPEPSGLILLGSGLLGVVGIARRRQMV